MKVAGGLLAAALLMIELGPVTPARTTDRIRSSAERPVPTLPPRPAPAGGGVWVPDRFVPYPGEHRGVFVPGHWELPVDDGRVQVPPASVARPDTGDVTILPAGVRTLPSRGPQVP